MPNLERVEVRIRRILGPAGKASVAHSVYCPVRKESRLLVDCETCDRCAEITADGDCVVCETPPFADSSGTLGDVMTRDVFCVTTEMSVDAIGALLLERGFSGVPVVDQQGYPVGIVCKTDLLRERIEGGKPATAAEVMMPVAFTLEEHSPIRDAVQLMLTENVHHLPVVDSDGRVAGMLSTMDILRWLGG